MPARDREPDMRSPELCDSSFCPRRDDFIVRHQRAIHVGQHQGNLCGIVVGLHLRMFSVIPAFHLFGILAFNRQAIAAGAMMQSGLSCGDIISGALPDFQRRSLECAAKRKT
jgi:hypothetical protein